MLVTGRESWQFGTINIYSENTSYFHALESAFHWLFCQKFSFKLVTFSKSYARKQKLVYFLNTVYALLYLGLFYVRLLCPRPRRGGGGIRRSSASVVRPSVRLSVWCRVRRTSALTRKPKGLGRRNFAQGYPRSHATPTPTSRSKGQKSRSRGGGILWRAPTELPPGERLQI